MSTFRHIAPSDAHKMLEGGQTNVVDIRDAASFMQGHIDSAQRIDNSNVPSFLEKTDKELPLIVCCYHGISSQNAAQFFVEHGFSDVYSLDGGFEGWKVEFPITSKPTDAS